MLDYIDPLYFFISLFIGLFVAYVSAPVPDIVIKYPTPENAGKVVYKDDSDVCYKYEAIEVDCPSDKSKISRVGLQYVNNEDKNHKNIFSRMTDMFKQDKVAEY